MKFPSVKNLVESAVKTVTRFPFEVLFALMGTIASTINIELETINRVGENWCLRFIIVANLALLLSLAATLFAESNKLSQSYKLLLRAAAAVIALSILFIINPGIRQADYVRFFLLSLSLHLLVAFAAFTKGDHIQGFWQFNKTLFLRFLTAFLYGIVLFLGLSAAIAATNYLFNFKFEWDTFSILFTWIVGAFSTTFFLAGVPGDFAALDEDTSYPKGLKVFTQYVLIPLASVYVLILLAYEIKILVQWNLPKGAVSYLILSYAVFGILSLLLVYPIRDQEEHKWLKTYTRSFYFLLIPLLVLLFIAVGVRLSDYGITEFRYFLIALACWLLFITGYFLLFKKQNIKVIPISLCIVTLLSVYGPQSAFSVSMYSQRHILLKIFERNKAFVNGQLVPVKTMNKADGERSAEILDYLVAHHDLGSLQPYITVDLDKVIDSLSNQKDNLNKDFVIENYALREKKVHWAKTYLGVNKFSDRSRYYLSDSDEGDGAEPGNNYSFSAPNNITSIKGYDYWIDVKGYADSVSGQDKEIKFTASKSGSSMYYLALNNEQTSFDLAIFAKKIIANKKRYKASDEIGRNDNNDFIVPDDSLRMTAETRHYTVILAIHLMRLSQSKKGDIEINFADASYLVKQKLN